MRVRPRPLVFLERVALLEGKLADAPATGKPSTRSPPVPIVPTVPTAEAGNVGKLSSAGDRAVVRVVDACREPDTEDRWRVTIADDGEADARSCLCAAGVSACGVKPKSLVSVGTAGSADLDGVSTLVITSLSVVTPPPATAPTAGDSSSDESDDDAPATPAKRRPAMVQANLLSPDHGRPTFFVSPTGVENFPPLDFGAKDERPRWRREVDADATCFAGGPVEACVAREAFARRATLLRDLLDATDVGAPAARCSVDALVLEKVLRASVVASAPGGGAAAGLAQLYEATVNVAEKFDDPCGTDLAAARVLLSIHAVGERKKPDAPRVLFTGVRVDRHACAALAAAGAVRVTRPRDATHLVCPQPLRRTPKFLAAVSVVEHVVTQEWLRKSGELGRAAD